jgi:DNA-binding Lrp family transcriptional regulator
MPTAYILLNTEIGAETQVRLALKEIAGVEEVYNLWGVYDLIANVKAESIEELKGIITNEIEKVSNIDSKLTMVITDKPKDVLQDKVPFGNSLIQ